MKFKTLLLLFLILSCSPNYTKLDNKKAYSATGLAFIYNEKDYVRDYDQYLQQKIK